MQGLTNPLQATLCSWESLCPAIWEWLMELKMGGRPPFSPLTPSGSQALRGEGAMCSPDPAAWSHISTAAGWSSAATKETRLAPTGGVNCLHAAPWKASAIPSSTPSSHRGVPGASTVSVLGLPFPPHLQQEAPGSPARSCSQPPAFHFPIATSSCTGLTSYLGGCTEL